MNLSTISEGFQVLDGEPCSIDDRSTSTFVDWLDFVFTKRGHLMKSQRQVCCRATMRLNQDMLAALRDIDHPGLLADFVCCSDDAGETVRKGRSFMRAVSKLSVFMASRFATAPTLSPTYRG